jgi:hypothetical protein
MASDLYCIDAPHFVACLVVTRGSEIVTFSAPILAWARGKPLPRAYFAKKGWKVIEVEKGA